MSTQVAHLPQITWEDPIAPAGPTPDLYNTDVAVRAKLDISAGPHSGSQLAAAQQTAAAQAMTERRADRERHHHSQIWTKGFHGGSYRKVLHQTGLVYLWWCLAQLILSCAGCDQPIRAKTRTFVQLFSVQLCSCIGRKITQRHITINSQLRQRVRRDTTRYFKRRMDGQGRWRLAMSAQPVGPRPISWATT